MALKITSTEEKPLLARKEIKGELSFAEKATPSNDDVRKEIASQLKVDEKTVLVKHIYTAFGSSEAKIEAYVYNTEEDLKKYEPVTKAMKTKAGEGAEEGAEKPAEAPKEEKPKAAEEKKEEAPKEEAKPEEKKEEPKPEEKKE